MTDSVRAVLPLWDRVIALAEGASPTDWSRPTPDPGLDVRGVVSHVAVAPPAGAPAQLLEGLHRAREAYLAHLAHAELHLHGHGHHHRHGQDRALGAACLDLYVHAHDLAGALGVPVDLDEDSPAIREACRYVMGLAPKLFTVRAGAQAGDTLRLGVPGALAEVAALPSRRGEERPATDGTVTATPVALVLLLAGRGDPGLWRARGALEWTGESGEAFVTKARLLA
ncbi:MAG TPA: maleylpyruvate isomerase N-terminal domain-containing protein [Mycobacteriales bacterium]|jgi:hypothetical protein|nr:maleylpyruvate isomerase N-terminal domain-containing protein [Mycobacteriales bacterium]